VASTAYPDRAASAEGKTFLGHPRGLYVLFFAEMWERFSYYGMRALLIFYLTKHLLFGDDKAYLIYGAYTSLVYITPVIGGYLADKFLGHRKAVLVGGIFIALGHLTMSILEGPQGQDSFYLGGFYLGLASIIVGTGFLKANISVLVGQLYPRDDMRRDPAFTIFYMGINLGGMLGPLICGYLGETYGWSYGFGAAAVGMLAGLVVFVWFKPLLLGRGEAPDPVSLRQPVLAGLSRELLIYLGAVAGILVVWVLIQNQEVVGGTLLVFGILTVAYILWRSVFTLDRTDRDRIFAALFLIALQPLFWALFEQAGSSLSIFTDRNVDRNIGGWEVPASMFQSVNSAFIILLAPLFAWLWTSLGRRGLEPSAPAKFGLSLMQLGAGFLVLVAGAAAAGEAATPVIFIFLIYMLHTMAELCLSPVGLSAMARLAVPSMLGLIMGTWFLATAAGNFIAGLIARATGGGEGAAETASATQVMDVYTTIGWLSIGVGVVVIVISPLVKRLMHLDTLRNERDEELAGYKQVGEREAAGMFPDRETKPDDKPL
jgi:POT family proton-dependent oligopeptide transporter